MKKWKIFLVFIFLTLAVTFICRADELNISTEGIAGIKLLYFNFSDTFTGIRQNGCIFAIPVSQSQQDKRDIIKEIDEIHRSIVRASVCL